MGKHSMELPAEALTPPNLEEIAWLGTQQMLARAMKAEITVYIEKHQHIKLPVGKAAVVLNGKEYYSATCIILTGLFCLDVSN